jgi:hypothetical protein
MYRRKNIASNQSKAPLHALLTQRAGTQRGTSIPKKILHPSAVIKTKSSLTSNAGRRRLFLNARSLNAAPQAAAFAVRDDPLGRMT